MNASNINWRFVPNALMPIIRVYGTATVPELQQLLLAKSVELIDMASKYEGIPITPDIPHTRETIMVSFTLLFKNHQCAQKFLQIFK